jgi:hypothetical protein
MMFCNVRNCPPSGAASYPRRKDSFLKVKDGGGKFL